MPWQHKDGKPYYENKLWVSNQSAMHLMEGFDASGKPITPLEPPATGDPANNPNSAMIDAQLTTEIFGFFAPGRPDVALSLGQLPVQAVARGEAQLAAEFYIIMYSLAAYAPLQLSPKERVVWLATQARKRLTEGSITAAMYDFVKARYDANPVSDDWEATRDELYREFQLRKQAGYEYKMPFDSAINFGASIISLLYGEGDLPRTTQIATLVGWDSDNPTATWGGLLGFLLKRSGVEAAFGQTFSTKFNIHATRKGFPNDGQDDFSSMAARGVRVVDACVVKELGGAIDSAKDEWVIPTKGGVF